MGANDAPSTLYQRDAGVGGRREEEQEEEDEAGC
jgi:hypothetical protein